MTGAQTFPLDGRPETVPRARHFVTAALRDAGLDDLVNDAAVVATELVSNALLHAPDAPSRLWLELGADEIRILVQDGNPVRPVPRVALGENTTGRGLSLVAQLSARWGVRQVRGASPGKVVWALVRASAPSGIEDETRDLDVDAFLAAWPDDDEAGDVGPAPELFTVRLGSAPTALMLEAKEHLDGLVREVALAAAGAASAVGRRIPPGLAVQIDQAVHRVGEMRRQIRLLCLEADAAGDPRVDLVLSLPADVADAAEQYLDALSDADSYARDARMLTLESPVEFRVLRSWYVEGLVRQLRGAALGSEPAVLETFEERLIRELRSLEGRHRSAELAAKLQRITATLGSSEQPAEIAEAVVAEGIASLGASGGMVATLGPDLRIRPFGEHGADEGLTLRYRDVSGDPYGPSRTAILTATPIWVESREERDARFPHLATLQPDSVSFAAVPLLVAGEVVGVLRFSFSAARIFDTDEREYLIALASQTALAISRTRALQNLRDIRDQQQTVDPDASVAAVTSAERIEGDLSAPTLNATDIAMIRTLYGDAPIGVAILDVTGRYLRLNRVVAESHGSTPAQDVGRTLRDVHGAEAEQQLTRIAQVVASNSPVLGDEFQIADATGARRFWRCSWFPIRDVAESVTAVLLLASEFTAEERADGLRRRAEDHNRILANTGELLAAGLGIRQTLDSVCALLVPDTGHTAAVYLRASGHTLEVVAARHADPLRDSDFRELFAAFPFTGRETFGPGAVLTGGLTQQLPDVSDDVNGHLDPGDIAFRERARAFGLGGAVIVPLTARGRTLGALAVSRERDAGFETDEVELLEDIGRRLGLSVANEQALASSVRLDLALAATEMGTFDWSLETGELAWDDRMCAVFGLEPGAWTSEAEFFYSLVAVEDRTRVRSSIEHAIETSGELSAQFRIVAPDGGTRWIESRGRAVSGVDGVANRLLGMAFDVTELRENRDGIIRALEHIADGFVSVDVDWRYTYVNAAAERLLGRTRDELLGRRLWDLYPELLGTRTEARYLAAMASSEPSQFDVSSAVMGRRFQVRAYPGPDGISVYFTDIAQQRQVEGERDRATARLTLLDRAGAALAETLDVGEGLSRLAQSLVPELADLVAIDIRSDDPYRDAYALPPIVTGSRPEEVAVLEGADRARPRRHDPDSAVSQIIQGGTPTMIQSPLEELVGSGRLSADQEVRWGALPMPSALVVPLTGRGSVLGAVTLIRSSTDAVPYTEDDLTLAIEIGRRAGIMLDNAARYETQRILAETLQRSLLPDLPRVQGIELIARYEPSSAQAMVGGDWYDAFPLPGGGLALVIGDVMGHDIAAAAAMGQLRSVLRTCAADGDRPAAVLDRLDRLVSSFAMADLATVIYARLDRHPDGSASLSYANAGHPPPLLLSKDGSGRFMREASSTMIGAPGGGARNEAVVEIPSGATLLLYTDGLVERRRTDLGDRLEILRAMAGRECVAADTLNELGSALMAVMQRDAETDDAALLAVRVNPVA